MTVSGDAGCFASEGGHSCTNVAEAENRLAPNQDEQHCLSREKGGGVWPGIREGHVLKAVAMFEGANARALQESSAVCHPTSQRRPLSSKEERESIRAAENEGACARPVSPPERSESPDSKRFSPQSGVNVLLCWQPSLLEGDSQHALGSEVDRETDRLSLMAVASEHEVEEEAAEEWVNPTTVPDEAALALRTPRPLCTHPASASKDKEEQHRLQRRIAWCSSQRIARSQAPRCDWRDPPRARSACKSVAAEQCRDALQACAVGREILAEAPSAGLRSRLEAITRLAERIQREEEWASRAQNKPELRKRQRQPPRHLEVGFSQSQERPVWQSERRGAAAKGLPEALSSMPSARASSRPASSQRSSLTPRPTSSRSYVLVPATEQIREVVA